MVSFQKVSFLEKEISIKTSKGEKNNKQYHVANATLPLLNNKLKPKLLL